MRAIHTEEKQNVCDDGLYQSIFKQLAPKIRNYIYFKFGDPEKAEDVVQEAFIKLWENCSKVPYDKAKSYLYTIATNLSLNDVAHQKVKLKFSNQKSKNHTNESPEFILETEEFKTKLENSIANLSEAQRTAFLLNRIEGMKYVEIATHLQISVKAVEKRIHNALLVLRAEIGNI